MNVSEGRDPKALKRITDAAGTALLDVHSDPDHNRSVLTLIGEEAPRAVATACVEVLDLRTHAGVHPRLGVVDVVPFVPLQGREVAEAVRARDAFASWFGDTHQVPCFIYGGERTLPEVRREAFGALRPDRGPSHPHRTAGATAVGARPPLVAYNVWLAGDLAAARTIARSLRGPSLRALGLQVGTRVQVSMNLIDPEVIGPAEAFDAVALRAAEAGLEVSGAELVGLIPAVVLDAIPSTRWEALDLHQDRTIEARLAIRRI